MEKNYTKKILQSTVDSGLMAYWHSRGNQSKVSPVNKKDAQKPQKGCQPTRFSCCHFVMWLHCSCSHVSPFIIKVFEETSAYNMRLQPKLSTDVLQSTPLFSFPAQGVLILINWRKCIVFVLSGVHQEQSNLTRSSGGWARPGQQWFERDI